VVVDVVPSLPGNGTFLCTYTPRRKDHRKTIRNQNVLKNQKKKSFYQKHKSLATLGRGSLETKGKNRPRFLSLPLTTSNSKAYGMMQSHMDSVTRRFVLFIGQSATETHHAVRPN
jgi:hypothetical protein